MSVSRRIVSPSKVVGSANMTPCGVVSWLIIARMALFVAAFGMGPSVLISTCLFILVYSGEYRGDALVLFFWTFVKPVSLGPLSLFAGAAVAA